MKPEGAFFSGAILGVAGAYLYKNYESGKELKGGAARKNLFQIAMGTPTLENITAVCKQNGKKYSCQDGVLFNSDKTVLFKYTNDTDNTEYTIPDSVTTIVNHAFSKLSQLNKITISPNSNLESIGDEAFDQTGIVTIFIPDFVTTIGGFVFDGCSSLKTITVSAENKKFSSIDGVLFNKKKTELIRYPPAKNGKTYTIPSTVIKISGGAFDCCTGLKSIIIPDSVTTIGVCAFFGCTGLKSIIFPVSVKKIGERIFSGCTSLTSITIMNPEIVINDNAFDAYDSLKNITAPYNVLKKYATSFINSSGEEGELYEIKDENGASYKRDGNEIVK